MTCFARRNAADSTHPPTPSTLCHPALCRQVQSEVERLRGHFGEKTPTETLQRQTDMLGRRVVLGFSTEERLCRCSVAWRCTKVISSLVGLKPNRMYIFCTTTTPVRDFLADLSTLAAFTRQLRIGSHGLHNKKPDLYMANERKCAGDCS